MKRIARRVKLTDGNRVYWLHVELYDQGIKGVGPYVVLNAVKVSPSRTRKRRR